MGAQDAGGGRDGKRRARGFQRAGAAAAPLVRQAGASRGFAEQRLLRDWTAVAGAEFAAICRPLRMSHRGGQGLGATLVLAVDGPRAPEVEHMAPALIERVNQTYGYRAVSRVRIVQAAPAAGPDRPPHPGPAPVDRPHAPDICRIADMDLRAALAQLEANIRRRAGGDEQKDDPR